MESSVNNGRFLLTDSLAALTDDDEEDHTYNGSGYDAYDSVAEVVYNPNQELEIVEEQRTMEEQSGDVGEEDETKNEDGDQGEEEEEVEKQDGEQEEKKTVKEDEEKKDTKKKKELEAPEA